LNGRKFSFLNDESLPVFTGGDFFWLGLWIGMEHGLNGISIFFQNVIFWDGGPEPLRCELLATSSNILGLMPKHIQKWPILTLSLLLLFGACEKDFPPQPGENKPLETEGGFVTDRDGEPETVLGAAHSNPYAVETMRQAYNNLYPTDLPTLSPNYLYVRFLPQSPEDVGNLLKSGLELWDFPLHHDLISIGEEYQDPSITDAAYTWQYAVVPVDYSFPPFNTKFWNPWPLYPKIPGSLKKRFA